MGEVVTTFWSQPEMARTESNGMQDGDEQTREMTRGPGRGPFRVRVGLGAGGPLGAGSSGVAGAAVERVRTLKRGQSLTIGSSDEADVQVIDRTVSGVHCRLAVSEAGLEVTDLASRNGLVVGAGWVDRAVLNAPRAEFSIGATVVQIENLEFRRDTADLGMIGESDGMVRLREKVARYAELSAPVLVVGESGTGKDLVARALHDISKRRGAYVALNAAALPESLCDAELFGHARGAFTGAVASRTGAFELAHRGSLFLDEIAELSAAGQAKLLRVVEDGVVRPLGASQTTTVTTRLISATCAPLGERIEQGRFREDLYHRLSLLSIEVPPLRRRTSDIPLLARTFFARRVEEFGPKYLLPAAEEFLAEQAWPGNVRQLFGSLYRAAVLSEGPALGPHHFEIGSLRVSRSPAPGPERAVQLLAESGSVSAAARAAGIPRSTFRSILKRAQSP